ncbi:MAG: hypothetical protein PSX71_08785 [bacterium]|nr:hypothetical protein [bacterium]
METAIVEYSATEQALAELRTRYEVAVFDVSTGKGLDAAKAARAEIRGYRVSLEKMRVELKAPVIAHGKLLDDEAKRITAALVELEDPIDAIIKAEEKRKQEEKAERDRIEAARIADIRAKIAAIVASPNSAGKTSDQIIARRDEIAALVIDLDGFAELAGEAMMARQQAVATLNQMAADKKAHEDEQAAMAAERERQEKAAAEIRRQQEELRIAAEKSQREEAERLRISNAEIAQKQADAAAEIKRQQDAIIAQQDAAEADAQARREEQARADADLKAQQEALDADRLAFEESKKPEPAAAAVEEIKAPILVEAAAPEGNGPVEQLISIAEEITVLVANHFDVSEADAYNLIVTNFITRAA